MTLKEIEEMFDYYKEYIITEDNIEYYKELKKEVLEELKQEKKCTIDNLNLYLSILKDAKMMLKSEFEGTRNYLKLKKKYSYAIQTIEKELKKTKEKL